MRSMGQLEEIIVVVDDDPGMNVALTRLLTAAGFRVMAFASGKALLQAGSLEHVKCLILDVQMPDLSGFDLYRRLAQHHPPPPVIFMTAYDEMSVRQEAALAGAQGYLTKPFPSTTLLELLAKVGQNQ